jgi:hypothetical protein
MVRDGPGRRARRRKQAGSGKWFLVHSSSRWRGGQRITSLGPALGRGYPSHHQEPEGLGSEPADEPVAGPDSTWSFDRQAARRMFGYKRNPLHHHKSGSVDEDPSRSPQARYRVSSPRLVCLNANEPPFFAAGASICWYGPQVPIWTRAGTPMTCLDARISTLG